MAKSKTYRKSVVVLQQTKLSEQDLIVTCLAEDGTLIKAVAKGGRKPGSRLAPKAQTLTYLDALFAKGRALDILADAKTIENPPQSMRELVTNAAVSLVAEIATKTAFEETADSYLFNLFKATTNALLASEDWQKSTFLAAYIFKLFAHMGWWPQLEHCALCGAGEVSAYSVSEGGVICERCAETTDDGVYVTPEQLSLLRLLIPSPFSKLEAIVQKDDGMLLKIACAWAETQGGLYLKSAQYYIDLMQGTC